MNSKCHIKWEKKSIFLIKSIIIYYDFDKFIIIKKDKVKYY